MKIIRAFSVSTLCFALIFVACDSRSAEQFEKATKLQSDIRRAIIATKSLGRFGAVALFQEEMEKVPCRVPLSQANRVCEVDLTQSGPAKLTVADLSLSASGNIKPDALIAIDYTANCENIRFDFKTIDNSLARGPTKDGVTIWENKLIRVTHFNNSGKCSMRVEVAPALLERVKEKIG